MDEEKKDRLPNRAQKSPERELENERSTVDLYPKRQTNGAELYGDRPVQTDRGRVAGESAVFGAADPGEAAGDGV